MQLTSLHIDGFGQFADFDLDGLTPGLVLVHGPNEAGKSTLRHFVRWMLFPAQPKDARRWSNRFDHLGGELGVLTEGGPGTLVRRGRELVLRSVDGRIASGDGALAALTGGMERSLYDAIFTFDLMDLQRVEALGDERVQHLLAVGATVGGGPHPVEILRALDAEAQVWWRPRAPSAKIRVAQRQRATLVGELSLARDQAGAYGAALEHIAEVERALVARRQEAAAEHARLHALRLRRDLWATWCRCLELGAARDAATRALGPPLVAASRERVEALRDAWRRALGAHAAALVELEAARGAHAGVTLDARLLEATDAIEALADRRAAVERSAEDVAAERQDLAVKDAALAHALAQLGPGWDPQRVAGVATGAPVEIEARGHQEHLVPLLAQVPAEVDAAEQAVRRSALEEARVADELAAIAPVPLEAVLERAEAALAEADARLGDLRALEEARAQGVGLSGGALADEEATRGWPALSAGDVEEIRGFAARWRDAQVQREADEKAAKELVNQAEQANAAAQDEMRRAEALPGAGAPSTAVVADLQARWPQVRSAFDTQRRALADERRVAAAVAELPRGLGPGATLAQIGAVDLSVGAQTRAARALEAVERASAEELRAQAALAALAAGGEGAASPGDGAAAAVAAEAARARRGRLIAAKAALDELQQAGAAAAPRAAEGRLVRALPVALLLLLALAAAFVAWALAVAAGVAALVVALVGVWSGRARAAAAATVAPEGPEARRRFGLALREAGLADGAGRGEIERAFEDVRDVLEGVARAEEQGQRAALAQARVAAARTALAEAEAAGAARARERDEALAAAGLPVGAERALADAWTAAARALRDGGSAREAARRAHEEAAQTVADFGADLAAAGHGGLAEEAALEAALGQLREALQVATVREDALRAAQARVSEAARVLAGARAQSAAVARAEAVPAALVEGWAAWGRARGLAAGPPVATCVAAAQAAAVAWRRREARVALAQVVSEREARVGPFDAEVTALILEAGRAGGATLLARVAGLRAGVAEVRARRAARERLEGEGRRAAAAMATAREAEARAVTRVRQLALAQGAFAAWAGRVEAPAGSGAAEAVSWVERLRDGQRLVREREGARERVARTEALVRAWRGEVGALAARLGEAEGEGVGAAFAWVKAVRARLEAARDAATRVGERAERVAAVALAERRAWSELERHEGTWREALGAIGCADELAWEARVAGEVARDGLVAEAGTVEAELRGALGASWADPEGWGAAADGPGWEARVAVAEAAVGELGGAVEELERERGERVAAARRVEASAAVVERDNALAQAQAELAAGQREWWRLVIARQLLADTFERFRRERQPAVLRRAGAWLAAATEGAYDGIEADDSVATLRFAVRGADGAVHPAEALSTGTTALLYLCLRLALAVDQAGRTAAVPLLLDDVLAHFDPARALGAARLLVEVARTAPELQLVMFTCRPEAVAMVRAVAPETAVVELARWAGGARPVSRGRGVAAGVARVSAPAAGLGGAATPAAGEGDARDGGEAGAGAALAGEALLELAVATLGDERRPLAKAELLAALGIAEAEWAALRRQLEGDARVTVTGARKGCRYALVEL